MFAAGSSRVNADFQRSRAIPWKFRPVLSRYVPLRCFKWVEGLNGQDLSLADERFGCGRSLDAGISGCSNHRSSEKMIKSSLRASNVGQTGNGISAEGRAKRVMPASRLTAVERSESAQPR